MTVDFSKMNEDQVCFYIGKLLIDNLGSDTNLFWELQFLFRKFHFQVIGHGTSQAIYI